MVRTTVFHHPVPGSGFIPGPAADTEIVLTPDRPGYALAPEHIDRVTLIATSAHDDDVPWIPDHLRPLTAELRQAPATAVDQLTHQLGGLRGDLSMLTDRPT